MMNKSRWTQSCNSESRGKEKQKVEEIGAVAISQHCVAKFLQCCEISQPAKLPCLPATVHLSCAF